MHVYKLARQTRFRPFKSGKEFRADMYWTIESDQSIGDDVALNFDKQFVRRVEPVVFVEAISISADHMPSHILNVIPRLPPSAIASQFFALERYPPYHTRFGGTVHVLKSCLSCFQNGYLMPCHEFSILAKFLRMCYSTIEDCQMRGMSARPPL